MGCAIWRGTSAVGSDGRLIDANAELLPRRIAKTDVTLSPRSQVDETL